MKSTTSRLHAARYAVCAALAALAATACRRTAPTATASAATVRVDLNTRLAAIAGAADGRVGVSVQHVETGARAAYHGAERFSTESVFKFPTALALLADVDAGALRLDDPLVLTARDLRRGLGDEPWVHLGEPVTVRTLVEHMVQDSSNTACDRLLALLGGTAATTARLRALGVEAIDLGRTELEMDLDVVCPGAHAPSDGWTREALEACERATPPAAQALAFAREAAQPRNAATPDALVALLARLQRGEVLRPASRAFLLATLAGTRTGAARLRGLLPAQTVVAHKTGTGPSSADGVARGTNDVGLVTLPDGSHLAIAVMTTGSRRPIEARERVIAELARAAWDAFSAR